MKCILFNFTEQRGIITHYCMIVNCIIMLGIYPHVTHVHSASVQKTHIVSDTDSNVPPESGQEY